MIEGECGAEDVKLAFKMLCPEFSERLDLQPSWEKGTLGMMQLIAMVQLYKRLYS